MVLFVLVDLFEVGNFIDFENDFYIVLLVIDENIFLLLSCWFFFLFKVNDFELILWLDK